MSAPLPKPTTLSADLELEGRSVKVTLSKASRLSLHVELPDPEHVKGGTVFDRVVVHAPGREVTLTRCRLHLSGGALGQLIFIDDIYDCAVLFEQHRASNLLAFLHELPLVLSARDRIKPEFQRYVADLSYDLAVYKKFFDEQDRTLAHEAPQVAAAAQTVLLERAGKEFFRFLDASLERLNALVAPFTPEEHERHGYYFRQQLWPFIMSAAFMQRTNLKPRGYAGDALMMQMIYDNAYEGAFVFNQLMHKHPVEHAAAQAVRNRRMLVPRLVRGVLDSTTGPFRVLSVACGPARELEDLFVSDSDFERVKITLLDQDDEAIGAAKALLARLSEGRRPIDATWVNDSVRTLLRTRDLAGRLGRFHFIYTMGLFDYLTPPVARALLTKLYELLEPGGRLVAGNYHPMNPSRYYMAYWLDWVLYYRSPDEMMALAADLDGAITEVEVDASGSQLFLKVTRP